MGDAPRSALRQGRVRGGGVRLFSSAHFADRLAGGVGVTSTQESMVTQFGNSRLCARNGQCEMFWISVLLAAELDCPGSGPDYEFEFRFKAVDTFKLLKTLVDFVPRL